MGFEFNANALKQQLGHGTLESSSFACTVRRGFVPAFAESPLIEITSGSTITRQAGTFSLSGGPRRLAPRSTGASLAASELGAPSVSPMLGAAAGAASEGDACERHG